MEALKREIEALKKEKIELQRLVNKAKVYFNHSDLAYIVLDKEQNIVNVNETFSSLFGYEREEIISLPFSQLFTTPQLYHTWRKNYLHFGEFESVSNLEYRLQKKNRLIFWGELFGKKFENEEGEFSIWSIRDISLRIRSRNTIRNLNAKLQKQFEELEDILDIVPVPIFTKDKTFRYIHCNKAFCTFLKLKKEMILGRTVYDLFPKEKADFYQQKDEEIVHLSYQTYKVELYASPYHKDFVFEVHKKRVMREEEFEGFVGVLIDITQKEEQEQYLQSRVQEEIEKNFQNQLLHEKEMIRNAKFTSIGQMAAGITHEINTPLTYVKGNFEMLIEDIELFPSSLHRDAMLHDSHVIKEGLERIESIIETMREASQKSREQAEEVNLYATIVSALMLSRNRSHQVVNIMVNGKPFDKNMAKDEMNYTCYLQKQRIEQVWLVILNNALDELVKIEDFEKRSLHVEISKNNKIVKVRFCDNAGGINSSILPRIFEPFESTKESSGIGIGLNIAQTIVMQNDGNITAYNEGDGAVFEIVLPLIKR